MEKKFLAGIGLLAMLLAGAPSVSRADVGCVEPMGGGGGEVPHPFDYNRKVELADGESYLLYGKVIQVGTGASAHPVFKVDLAKHKWLANRYRLHSPYYPLEVQGDDWHRLVDKQVRLLAVAHLKIANDTQGTPVVTIWLEPEPDTALTKRRR